jgi:hypothetical protein
MHDEIASVMVHVNEYLDEHALSSLEDEIREEWGVVSVDHNPRHPHLLMVNYDSAIAQSSSFMHQFQDRGLHAQLVGL